jgi:hydroxymethylglutaryl-CoA reductase (NADPH)
MAVPSFLLRKLYVKGSLKNTDDGFEFALKNNLAPGGLIGIGPVTLDDTTIPPASITMRTPQGDFQGDQITSRNPLSFGLNVQVTVAVHGHTLTSGSHHVVVAVLTREVGRIEIDLTDTV